MLTMLTVTVSILSLITVEAGVGFGVSCSKLPPVALSMVTLTVEPLLYTSLAGVWKSTLPWVLPASMVMVWPLDRVTVTGVCAGLLRVTV
ncbi:hypothetical protein D3C72_1548530 [compost metagenome]